MTQSSLIDGVLLPIDNANKLLPSFTSKSQCTIAFLNLSSSDSSYTIVDHDQRFLSIDTLMYRQFILKHLFDVNLIVSLGLIDPIFLFELHQAHINVIDSLDEQTFEFLLQVFQCSPCNRLILFDDERIDRRTTVLLDRHVLVNQQSYIYLSSNGQFSCCLFRKTLRMI